MPINNSQIPLHQSSLLFIGCSLNNDRTMQVFKAVRDLLCDQDKPQHFSIEQSPDILDAPVARNAQLVNLGITPIWSHLGNTTLWSPF